MKRFLLSAVLVTAVFVGQVDAQPDLGFKLWTMRYNNSQRDFAGAIREAEAILKSQVGPEVKGEVLLHKYFAEFESGQLAQSESTFHEFCRVAAKLPLTLNCQMRDLRISEGLATQELPSVETSLPSPVISGTREVSEATLRQILNLCQESGAEGVRVLHRGIAVLDWRSAYYHEPMMTMSSVKSITGLLVGIAVDQKLLDINDPVSKYIPSWSQGRRSRVRISHLLTMTSGLERLKIGVGSGSGASMNSFVTNLEPGLEPGERWIYSNEGVQLLCPILEKACQQPLGDFARRELFEPMGLQHTQLAVRRGEYSTYADAETTLDEFALFGQLMLERGQLGGKQIVPESWLEQTVQPSPLNKGYGYLWWLNQNRLRVYSMQGYLDTSVWVFPEHDLVIARVQSRPYLHCKKQLDLERLFQVVAQSVNSED